MLGKNPSHLFEKMQYFSNLYLLSVMMETIQKMDPQKVRM